MLIATQLEVEPTTSQKLWPKEGLRQPGTYPKTPVDVIGHLKNHPKLNPILASGSTKNKLFYYAYVLIL